MGNTHFQLHVHIVFAVAERRPVLTFADELRGVLQKHGVRFEEAYLLDN